MQRWTSQQVRAYVAQAINSSSRSNACEAFTGVDVWIDSASLYDRPDVLVVRREPRFQGTAVLNPEVIVEVLSDETRRLDHVEKVRQYRTIPELRNYVLVSHDEPLVEFFWREEAGWLLRDYEGLDTRIDIEAIGVKLPMRDVYRGVEFPAASE